MGTTVVWVVASYSCLYVILLQGVSGKTVVNACMSALISLNPCLSAECRFLPVSLQKKQS